MTISRRHKFAFTVVALTLALHDAGAQVSCSTGGSGGSTCTTSSTVAMTIAATTMLTAAPGPGFSLAPASGVLTVADYESGGYDVASTITLTARANATWSATMAASTASFAAPCASKPVADLLWGRNAAARTTPLALSPAPAFALASNGATAGLSQTLYFRVKLGWTTDAPGSCTLNLTFAINAP